ncbi:MAG TPA: VIT1/CCC1 transporter family protein [Chthonomonadaceae bacterium]|nr:VIT1/CCC1 transporter family protein [Chthonomonadaceae bacterium]
MKEQMVIGALLAAWEREIEAAQMYRLLGEQQEDERRQRIFIRLAEAEEGHAREFAARIEALGGTAPIAKTAPTPALRMMARALGTDAMLRRLEAEEERNIAQFGRQVQALAEDAESHALFLRIENEEKQHATLLHSLKSPDEPKTRLEAMLKGEKWHVSTGSWIGDLIYGVNDGLGAVFGVISGMAGATDGGRVVLVSGMVAMLASALSMGSGAFMAAKSEREVYEAEIERERAEIEQSPEHEKEELELLLQLKGLSESEAHTMAERIAASPEQFLKTMAQEELGLSERHFPNPWKGAASAAFSTAVGGIVPVIPFFFMSGIPAIFASAAIGMLAHFAVGAAKSLVTARTWWASGLEMTAIAVITGGVTFGLGKLFHIG